MAENKEIPWEKELIEKYMFTLHKEQVKNGAGGPCCVCFAHQVSCFS